MVGQATTLTATSPSEPNGTSIAMNIPSGVTGSGQSGCYTSTGGSMTCSENVTSNTAGTYNFSAIANLAGNQVPDSSLKYATYPNNPTWTPQGVTLGTGNGDWTINNAGSTSAQFQYTGTGSAATGQFWSSQSIPVIPGDTYTAAAVMNAVNVSTGDIFLVGYYGGSINNLLFGVNGVGGADAQYSGQFTVPAGVTSIQVAPEVGLYGNQTIVTAGATATWSQIQVTQSSSAQPYAPGAITASSATSNSVSISWTQPLTPPVVSVSPTTQTVASPVTITAVGTNEGSGVTIAFNNPANTSQVSQNCTTSGSTITCTEQVTTTVAGTYDFSATAYPPPGVNVSPDASNIVGVTWSQPSPPSGYEFMPTSMNTSTTGPPSGSMTRGASRA